MGHGPSVMDEPLKPSHQVTDPPWHPRFLGKKYEGRQCWWADIGYEEPLLKAGMYRGPLPSFKEQDKYWYDPELPPGESIAGPFGLDTRYNRNLSKKADQPGELSEFQQKVMKNSVQYKQIAEKWKLSPEHPGIAVNPSLDSLRHQEKWELGRDTFLYTKFHHLGPRFWDKPINDGCIEKGLALAKYTAFYVAFPVTWTQLRAQRAIWPGEPIKRTPGAYIRLYLSNLPLPATIAMVYGTSWCMAAKIRYKDDLWNIWTASAFTGATLGTIKANPVAGVLCGLICAFLGGYYQYLRIWPAGLQGRMWHTMTGGLHWGPLSHKLWEGNDPPAPVYRY